MTSVLSPRAMADQACACAGVGAAKVPVNQSSVAGLKLLRGSGEARTPPSCQSGPTSRARWVNNEHAQHDHHRSRRPSGCPCPCEVRLLRVAVPQAPRGPGQELRRQTVRHHHVRHRDGAVHHQLYFHEFHAPVAQDRAAPPVVSPIKSMSYAIQDSPWRPWRELLTLTVGICWSLTLLG